MVKNSFIEKNLCCGYTLELPHRGNSMSQFQCVPTTYVTENKEENYLKIYIFQVLCPLSLPILNIPNSANQY